MDTPNCNASLHSASDHDFNPNNSGTEDSSFVCKAYMIKDTGLNRFLDTQTEHYVQESNNISCMGDEIAKLKRDLAAAQKVAEVAKQQHMRGELLLSRALEDCKQYKSKLEHQVKQAKGEEDAALRLQLADLSARVKVLQRQRAEFITAFKSQLKLIDVLQRQKLHTESAVLLNFTEQEFMRMIESE